MNSSYCLLVPAIGILVFAATRGGIADERSPVAKSKSTDSTVGAIGSRPDNPATLEYVGPNDLVSQLRQRLSPGADLRVASPAESSVRDLDVGQQFAARPWSCRTGTGATARLELTADGSSSRLHLESPAGHRAVIEPDVTLRLPTGAIPNPTIACSHDEFVFVSHPLMGGVRAFDGQGQELWRRALPRFKSVARHRFDNLGALIRRLLDDGSQVSQLVVSGPNVLVEFRTGSTATFQAVFRSDGKPLGLLGPTDSLVVGATEGGWRLVGGGGSSATDIYHPKFEFELVVTGDR